jgi:hypothetical protein
VTTTEPKADRLAHLTAMYGPRIAADVIATRAEQVDPPGAREDKRCAAALARLEATIADALTEYREAIRSRG